MCVSASMMQLGGGLMQGFSAMQYGRTQATLAEADAAAERDAAQQEAKRIMRAAAKRKGAARAATAASGARLDSFALGVEQDIDEAAETDAAMTMLSAKRRGDTLRTQAKFAKASAMSQMGASLMSTAYNIQNWRGAKGKSAPARTNDIQGVTGDNAYERWLREGVGAD